MSRGFRTPEQINADYERALAKQTAEAESEALAQRLLIKEVIREELVRAGLVSEDWY